METLEFEVYVDFSNAAFDDMTRIEKIKELVKELEFRLEFGTRMGADPSGKLMDENGNAYGRLEITHS